MEFKTGEFQTFRATTRIHLGKLERDIQENDVFSFDGMTVKYAGDTFALSTLKGAIKAGWIVLAEDTDSTYVPQSSNIKIRPAQSADGSRGEPMPVEQVVDEERVVGTVGKTSNTETTAATNPAEGTPVGRIKNAASTKTQITDSSSVSREINRLDHEGSSIEDIKTNVGTATGDVENPITGSELTDLLPNAASAKKTAKSKTSTSKTVTVSVGDSDLNWDMSTHWRTRVSTIINNYGGNQTAVDAILSVESDGVKKAVTKALGK